MKPIGQVQLVMLLILVGCSGDGGTTGVDAGDGNGDSGGLIPRAN